MRRYRKKTLRRLPPPLSIKFDFEDRGKKLHCYIHKQFLYVENTEIIIKVDRNLRGSRWHGV